MFESITVEGRFHRATPLDPWTPTRAHECQGTAVRRAVRPAYTIGGPSKDSLRLPLALAHAFAVSRSLTVLAFNRPITSSRTCLQT